MTIQFTQLSDTARCMYTALEGTDTQGRNPKRATEECKKLYQQSLQVIAAEINKKPLLQEEEILPIITEIDNTLECKGYQDSIPFLRTISKVYRIFIELRWYKPWMSAQEMPVFDEVRDGFIEKTSQLETLLSRRKNCSDIIFELKCAQRAAMRLTPSEALWKKYTKHALKMGAAAVDRSAIDTLEALRKFAQDLQQDCPEKWSTWYQEVHLMRWHAISLQSEQEFDQKIPVETCLKKGGNRSLGLAKTVMYLLKHPENTAVKDRSFTVLTKLAIKEKIPGLQEIVYHPKELINKVLLKPDRFGETRLLCMRYLFEIALNKKGRDPYKQYQLNSAKLLKDRAEHLKIHQGRKKYQEEIEEINTKTEEIEKSKAASANRRDAIEPQIEQLENQTKNPDVIVEFENPEEAIAEWERLDELVEEKEKEVKELKEKVTLVETLEETLKKQEKTEQEYLETLLQEIS